MRQLTFVSRGRVEWRETPTPTLGGPLEAVVRPLAVALCDIDGAFVRGDAPAEGPFPFGHEGVAEVVDVGEQVRTVRPGDRVVVPFQVSCGACGHCRRGLTAHCETVPAASAYGLPGRGLWGGFLSDLVRVPFAESMLVPLPAGLDPVAVASVSDNIPDAWRAVGPCLEERPGADVLIVAGWARSIGLYAVEIALAMGAGRVDYLDQDPARLALAEQLGAHPVGGPPPRRLGPYPVTVDASGKAAGLACALRSTEPGGVCTSVAIYFGPETPLPLFSMYMSGITFRTGRVQARPLIPKVLDLVAQGRLRPERVTSAVVPWDQAAEAVLDPPTKLIVSRLG